MTDAPSVISPTFDSDAQNRAIWENITLFFYNRAPSKDYENVPLLIQTKGYLWPHKIVWTVFIEMYFDGKTWNFSQTVYWQAGRYSPQLPAINLITHLCLLNYQHLRGEAPNTTGMGAKSPLK